MIKKAIVISSCLVAMGVSSHLLGAIPSAQMVKPAYAGAKIDFKHTINLADRERLLSQRMSKELLLVALGYNKKENLRNLQSSHDMFSRVLKGLHYGDAELALEPVDDTEVLDKLSRVEEIWPLFEAALNDSVTSGHVLRDHVEIVADLSLPLLQAMDEAVDSYEELDAREHKAFSLIDHAINLAGRQRMLTQKMSTEYLLIAYGHSVEVNRRRLTESMAEFERTMDGLINGNPDLKLLAAPNTRIRSQLRAVHRLWQDFKPMVVAASKGTKIDEDALSEMASLNLRLLSEMDSAVNMYEGL